MLREFAEMSKDYFKSWAQSVSSSIDVDVARLESAKEWAKGLAQHDPKAAAYYLATFSARADLSKYLKSKLEK